MSLVCYRKSGPPASPLSVPVSFPPPLENRMGDPSASIPPKGEEESDATDVVVSLSNDSSFLAVASTLTPQREMVATLARGRKGKTVLRLSDD